MTWTLHLPLTRPLSLNQRLHWAARARLTKLLRTHVAWQARAQHIPHLEHAVLQLHWRPAVYRRRDGDNWRDATVKPCADGLVEAGVLDDDDTSRVRHAEGVLHPPGRPPAVWLVIEAAP